MALITRHTVDGVTMKVTRDTIKAKGYQRWVSVTCMDTNESRIECCEWYVGLIRKGIIKQEGQK